MRTLDLVLLEARRLRRDRLFWIATFLTLLALLAGLANGLSWSDEQRHRVAAYEAETQQSFEALRNQAQELRDKKEALPEGLTARSGDPRYALGFEGAYTQHACRAPGLLAALGLGQNDLFNACILTSAWETGGDQDEKTHRALENPLRLLLGRFDVAFVAITLLPIAIIAIAYNLLSSERELGVLPLLAAQPVTIRRLMGVRLAVRATAFLVLTLGAMILGLAVAGAPTFTGQGALLFGVWLLVTIAYGLFWFACAFFINARGGGSAENGLALAGIWMLLVVVAPGALNLGLKQLYPMPSRMAYIDETREASLEIEKKKTELLGKYLIDHPDRVPGGDKAVNVDDYIQTKMALTEGLSHALAPHDAAFRSQQERQQALVDAFRFVSPAIVYQQIGQTLTCSDGPGYRRFLDAAEAHHRNLQDFFFPRLVKDGPDFADYDAIPRFGFQEVGLHEALSSVSTGLAGLLTPTLFLVIVGWWRMNVVTMRGD